MSAAAYSYPGDELDLFAHATTWKSYWAAEIAPYLRGRVLEVGAGLGANTALLAGPGVSEWLCLEPDARFVAAIEDKIARGLLPDCCHVRHGTLATARPPSPFDTVLYLDVLEHIAEDADELRAAADLLVPGGSLVVLAPAHHWLFSPFDAALGHYRRYSAGSLAALTPAGTSMTRLCYLDSAGLLLSLSNLLLRSKCPTRSQILFWDRVVVPISRRFDRAAGYRLGKSVLAVWRRVR